MACHKGLITAQFNLRYLQTFLSQSGNILYTWKKHEQSKIRWIFNAIPKNEELNVGATPSCNLQGS